MDNICEVELVYAKDVIPTLTFMYQSGVFYYDGYVNDWRNHLMDTWGETKAIGLKKRGCNVLAHPEHMWFSSKESAIKWANESHLKVINQDFI